MIASLIFRLSYRRFLRACDTPLGAQAARLRVILRQAARTEIGRRHRFSQLARIADPVALVRAYQAQIPIRSHGEMRADLDAVYAGDWQRLCPSRPLFFAMTAGSTGRFKYIPVTREYRKEVGRASLILYGAMEAADPSLRKLRCQFLVGSAEGGMGPSGIPQGFASGFNYKHLPGILRRRFVLPYWVFTIEDAEERAYAAARLLLDEPRLGALSAISPVNLINLRAALEHDPERLFADLAAGTLTVRGPAAVPGRYRGRPNPALAEALRQAWQRTGQLPDRLLFPSLRLLVCWQGGNMGYYLPELDRSFGLGRHFEFPISASEGVFAIACRPNQAGGVLAVTSHFLEFIPEDLPDGDRSRVLRADELEVGASYRVVVTNSGGLYRYDMEDIVRVTSRYRQTPVIEFVSKKDRQVSVSNERLTELDVTVAMQAASRRCGFRPPEFLFVPCSDRRYRVLVDGAALAGLGPDERESCVAAFATDLERQLRTAAKGYDFERDDALLAPLHLVVTAPHALKAYLDGLQPRHRLPNAQHKPRHLTNQFNVHEHLTVERTYAA